MKYILITALCAITFLACKTKQRTISLDKSSASLGATELADTTIVEDEDGNLKMIITKKSDLKEKKAITITKSGKDTTYVEDKDGNVKMIITEKIK